jgi:undecaprenyl pyrophosphate synthase
MKAVLFKKKETKIDRSQRILPQHVGIIMDGNGRWAK